MRKFLIAFCYTAELILISISGYWTYKSFYGQISYKQGLLTTILLMIASYWFSTFFEQLNSVKTGNGSVQNILKPKALKILSFAARALTLAIIFLWAYILIFKSGYFNNI